METYIFKFSVCLGIFWLVYVLFLERQNRHHFKRFYLLGALTLALIIPKLTITEYVEPIDTTFETAPIFMNIDPDLIEIPTEEPSFFDLETTLWFIYGFGVLLFTLRFVINLFKMQHRISKNETVKNQSFIYVLMQENLIPHSFFRYIFLNKNRYESNHIPKEVLLHEETHAKQLHSLDIIILEVLQIVFWFHPLIYILKHHVKLNHEFLADQAVLKQGVSTKTYQNILLQFSSNTQDYQFSSAINYSSIKKRFTVMKTQTSKTRVWLSTLLVLPIIAILFYSFAEKEYVEKDNIETSELLQVQNNSQSEEATEKLMQEYRDFITRYKETNTVHFNKYERAIIIYNELMSEKQRASVEKFPEQQENSLLKNHNFLEDYMKLSKSKVEPNQPTSAQFESWKNTKGFAIWLDGKNVPNSELDNYSVKDIVHFTESKVYKNARTAKFPQPFQSSLYTKEGFRKTYEEADLTKYRKLTKTYSEAIGAYLKGPQTDNSELKILKAQADKIYNSFTKEELEKHNILMAPPVPAQYTNSNSQEKPIMVILINRKGQLLVDDELGSLKSIELKLKTLSKSFDESNSVSVRIDKSDASEKTLENVIALVRKYDFKIIQADEPLIAPPPPPAKQTSKGGPNPDNTQSIYNPSFLEFIIEMENEGASFYLDDEEISAKEAKAIAANNKGKRTDILTQLDANEKYVVKLSNRRNNVSTDKEVGEDKEIQEKPTVKEVTEYNAWAKKLNSTKKKADENPKEYTYPIVKYKDVEKHKRIYNSMTTEQQKNTEPFPKFPPPPPEKQNQSFTKGEIIEVVEDPQLEKKESILPMINAKTIKTGKIALTRNEIKDIMLSTKNGKVTEFKFKIPGQPTQHIKSNVLDAEALKHLESAKKDDQLVLFAVKDGSNSEIAPIVITVTD
ncbi:M56 family metallopeptidase [Winogradskyella costae]|uniref:M56 family metallopeptidase n=1 Tax=Winogradskyella costae TaxID=2697008 RepID=UPI0015CCE65A|nr:M56 family metallopeptidase [Winogradskyella costae]